MKNVKSIDLKEFHELGFLQEINRRFLHPIGLAMSLTITKDDDTGEVTSVEFDKIWDYRDDPEGVFFNEIDEQKKEHYQKLYDGKLPNRVNREDFTTDENGIQS